MMVRIFGVRSGQPSWGAAMVATAAAMALGLLCWVFIHLFVDRDDDVRPRFPVPTWGGTEMVHRVKIIPIGPDPLAEPDPLAPYSGKP